VTKPPWKPFRLEFVSARLKYSTPEGEKLESETRAA